MNTNKFNQGLLKFISASPTPFHAVASMANQLESAGFVKLHENDSWNLDAGHYYVTRNDSSLIAFSLGDAGEETSGYGIVGAHTDSPCLKIKPNPTIQKNGYLQLGVEVYGGALLNPWFDRDLSIAGRISYRDSEGKVKSVLIDFRDPIAIIPSLAIHLDRDVNKKRSINSQTDIVPILFQIDDKMPDNFDALLALHIRQEHAEIDLDRVLDYELSLYDAQSPALMGLNKDFISSARLDNLLSCFVGMKSLMEANSNKTRILVCTDHEEVGSASACGAQGPFMKSVLERISGDQETLARAIDQSMMISCDNAHAIHPNYSDRHDGNHGPVLNKGPVIKTNANQRYATNSETAAIFRQHCEQVDVPVQDFVTRTDMACGSTIGPIMSTEIGVKTVDVGVPQFAMHSIRELCGSKDPYYLYQVLCEFYRSF